MFQSDDAFRQWSGVLPSDLSHPSYLSHYPKSVVIPLSPCSPVVPTTKSFSHTEDTRIWQFKNRHPIRRSADASSTNVVAMPGLFVHNRVMMTLCVSAQSKHSHVTIPSASTWLPTMRQLWLHRQMS